MSGVVLLPSLSPLPMTTATTTTTTTTTTATATATATSTATTSSSSSSCSSPEETDDDDDDDEIMMNLFESQPETVTSDDASVPSLSEDDVVMEDVVEETFGGMSNLGNTCYMNSATQMLASSDYFVETLEAATVEAVDADKLSLRSEFLQLLSSLRSGETVHPASFKKAVDKRSSLFKGYRQQDAHEFLTTLLDLLDEVYQVPAVSTNSNDDHNDTAATAEDATRCSNDEKESETKRDSGANSEEEAITMETDATVTTGIANTSEDNISRIQSFSELKVNEISKLLHGDEDQKKPEALQPTSKLIHETQCKLIGGRAVVTDLVAAPCLLKSSEGAEATLSSVPTSPVESRPAADNSNQSSLSSMTTTNAVPAPPTPIDDYFCTEVRSRLTCDSCKYSRTQMEKYLHLSIDISAVTSVAVTGSSIEEGLRKFFAPERREIKCEKCFCESATQSTEITKLPPALLIHFKRFIVDVSPDYSSITYRKNQSPVEFSETLRLDAHSVLREFMADDATVPSPRSMFGGHHQQQQQQSYQIRSIVNHIGSSASCGHYTADGNRLTGGERNWNRFNDANVSRISPEEAMSQSTKKTAYMVMYELGGGTAQ